jgi:hypothetical protein
MINAIVKLLPVEIIPKFIHLPDLLVKVGRNGRIILKNLEIVLNPN